MSDKKYKRYVRTQESVYELYEKQNLLKNDIIKVKSRSNPFIIKEQCYRIIDASRVLNTSDYIAELCDEFVILPKEIEGIHYIRKLEDLSHFDLESHIIYGAIWIKTGLKYVAKLNNEGELELLC